MRKQNQKMEENKERMEKLQKQYANNKDMYNQKVMEMYKENGISLFSSCLPMILSMIIFIVAINAFNDYASFSSVQNYNQLAKAYNNAVVEYCEDIEGYQKDGNVISVDLDCAIATVPSEYVEAQKASGVTEDEAIFKNYVMDYAQDAVVVEYETSVKENTKFLWIKNIWITDASYKTPVTDYADFSANLQQAGCGCGGCSGCGGGLEFINENGDEVSVTDLNTNVYIKESYDHITGKMTEQKDTANGYFVLIVLSIGTIILQQVLSMRANKAQQKYGTVDGQGGSQQKMMMFMMTGMFALFSFMYSSAFSIYMIMSNVLSLISTIVINFFVDKKANKKEAEAEYKKYSGRAARTAGLQGGSEKNKKK
jgi:YidC/Oxa1 family membrane protein insertase